MKRRERRMVKGFENDIGNTTEGARGVYLEKIRFRGNMSVPFKGL